MLEDRSELNELRELLERERTLRLEAEVALQLEVAARERAETGLQESREQFQAVLEAVPGGVSWISSDLMYLGINRNLAWTFHATPEDFIGQPLGFMHSSATFTEFVKGFFGSPARAAFQEVEMDVLGARRIYLIMAQKYRQGQAGVFVGVDITERKQYEEQLLHDAFYDGTTGLPNRALFMDRLGRALEHTRRRAHYLFAVLLLDLDRFKMVNDSLGHSYGDQLLVETARRLQATLRPSDTVARLGGDEFAILADDINDTSDAGLLAERLQQALAAPFELGDHDAFATASMGIALSVTGYERGEEMIRDADTALHRAKEMGRARAEIFDRHMHDHAVHRLRLETDLRHAVESCRRGATEFRLYYQPIISLSSERIVGLEALVRWQHPQRGLLYPCDFVPMAEETGLILELDRWVLHEACRQMRHWVDDLPVGRDLSISVNLSSKHFSEPDIVKQVATILDTTGLDASRLTLEITETVIMESPDLAADSLTRLRALGVRLSLDDFGTGYSSLSYLHRFPLNSLKIDRSFVQRIGATGENAEVVRAIVTLAHSLGIEVVVEGVETTDQLEQIKTLRGSYGQGFLFSHPLDGEAIAALVAGRTGPAVSPDID